MATKFVFVTGGVLSSLGKGLASASIGSLLESRGFSQVSRYSVLAKDLLARAQQPCLVPAGA